MTQVKYNVDLLLKFSMAIRWCDLYELTGRSAAP